MFEETLFIGDQARILGGEIHVWLEATIVVEVESMEFMTPILLIRAKALAPMEFVSNLR